MAVDIDLNMYISSFYCETPNPVQNWELTLLSLGKKKRSNNPQNKYFFKNSVFIDSSMIFMGSFWKWLNVGTVLKFK
jgi:hypothetical protein